MRSTVAAAVRRVGVGLFTVVVFVAPPSALGQGCTITCPANTPAIAGAQCTADVTYPAPITAGECGPITCVPAPGSTFPLGETIVTCTEDTGEGPGVSCSFAVTVQDQTPPTITCPPSQSAPAGPFDFPLPTFGDNCPDSTVACVPPPGTQFPTGTTIVTCTAEDEAGNTSSCSFSVSAVDPFSVPTLSGWGRMALLLLIAGAGLVLLQRFVPRA